MLCTPVPLLLPLLCVPVPFLLLLFLPMLGSPAPLLVPLLRPPTLLLVSLLLLRCPPRPTTPTTQGEALGLGAEALRRRLLLWLRRPDADNGKRPH